MPGRQTTVERGVLFFGVPHLIMKRIRRHGESTEQGIVRETGSPSTNLSIRSRTVKRGRKSRGCWRGLRLQQPVRRKESRRDKGEAGDNGTRYCAAHRPAARHGHDIHCRAGEFRALPYPEPKNPDLRPDPVRLAGEEIQAEYSEAFALLRSLPCSSVLVRGLGLYSRFWDWRHFRIGNTGIEEVSQEHTPVQGPDTAPPSSPAD